MQNRETSIVPVCGVLWNQALNPTTARQRCPTRGQELYDQRPGATGQRNSENFGVKHSTQTPRLSH